MPDSRLVLHARPGSHRQRLLDEFAANGVLPGQLEFIDFQPFAEYLATYQRINIALDPFPYGGGTTSCDAMWMGVPVVTLRGKTAVGRGTASLLTTIGLPELIAEDEEAYVRIATELACDPALLAKYRATLRERMKASPLCDGPGFARAFEAAIRTMITEAP